MTVQPQPQLSDYEKRVEHFERCMALLSRLIHAKPGMTTAQIGERFLNTYGFLPTIDNKLRHMRNKKKWIVSRVGGDKRLHWYPKPDEDGEKHQ